MSKVMIIDDSETVRYAATRILEDAGHQVITASDGFEAMAGITEHVPDVIFVDIVMPRLDGYQTCALIKNNNRFRSTPVVMLSSKDGLFDRARGRLAGAQGHINKPFDDDALLNMVTSSTV